MVLVLDHTRHESIEYLMPSIRRHYDDPHIVTDFNRQAEPGTYLSMGMAVEAALKTYHMRPNRVHAAARALGIEYELDTPFLELVALTVPIMTQVALCDTGHLAEENKRRRHAEAAAQADAHSRARRQQHIA